MNLHPDIKLFAVQFGSPDPLDGFRWSSNESQYLVLAKTYEEAADKAIFYRNNEGAAKKILDGDGSLVKTNEIDTIKSIKLITDKLVY